MVYDGESGEGIDGVGPDDIDPKSKGGSESVDSVEPPPSSESGESGGEIGSGEQSKEIAPGQVDPKESKTEVSSEQFDPNESNDEVSSEQFDPNESESSEEEEEFDPNSPDEEIEPEQFDPNEEEEKDEENEFDPNDAADMESVFDPSDYGEEVESELNPPDIDSEKSEEEQSEQVPHENISSQSTSTVLVSENEEVIQELDHDPDELEREIEKELEEGVEAVNQYLEEAAEFINAYQEMVGEARELDGEREEGEHLKTEEEWEKEAETAAYTAEQLYGSMEEIEANTNNEEISEINEELEIEKEVERNEEVSEHQSSDLQEEFEESMNEIEQHQVESLIEEALETEPEQKDNEKQLEQIQEMSLEEQFQTVHFNEYIEELVEAQNEEVEQEQEQEVEAHTENSEEKISELEEDLEERDEIEQHQVEAVIEEALETESESKAIVNDKEIEQLQEMDLEEQFQTVHFNESIEELVENQEKEKNQEQEVEAQIDNTKEIISELEEELEERDEIEQHQVEAAIEEAIETEPEAIINEKKLEQLQEMELEEQIQKVQYNEYIEELVEKQVEAEQLKEQEVKAQVENTKENVSELEEELEEQELELELEYEERNQVERHQVEAAIEEELETESKPIINEEELEFVKNFEPEKQLQAELLKEFIEELAQKKIEEKEEEQEISTEKVTQIKRKEEDSDKIAEINYECNKKLYKQQTGKRPIYANQETKGFKQWLEQKKQEAKEKQEPKKEEAWKWTLKNWIEEATEIDYELKSELRKLVEEYEELEELVRKFTQLYKKGQREKLSQTEKNELKSLLKELQKLDPIKIELFLSIREMKHYLDKRYYDDFWDKQRVNQIRSHFFTHLSQQYNNLKLAQKKKENSETIKNWIEQSSEEEMSPELRLKLKEVVEDYSELDKVATRFMKLHTKAQREKLSKTEKTEFQSLIKTLQKIEPSKIELFAKLRAFKRYSNDQNVNLEKKHVSQIFNLFFTGDGKVSNYTPLTSEQIQRCDLKYQEMLKKLCVKYAEDFKNILIEEYGHKILLLKNQIPLSTHFGFQLTKYITKVTNSHVRRAVSVEFLERIKQYIIQKYSKLKNKTAARETSFKEVIAFINEYQEFSEYVSKRFAISRIKYQEGSEKLEIKSWLIENLRYMFPKRFGLPLSDNLLSWYIFGDVPVYGMPSKLVKHTGTDEALRQMSLSDLLSINYRITKLAVEAFSDKGIEITDDDLEILKKSVSYLGYYYVFGGYGDSTQVSATKRRGAEVGKSFFTIEYDVIRAIFFAASEANNGEPLGIRALSKAMGIPDISVHLRIGTGFGEHMDKILYYFKELSKNRTPDSNSQIFRDAKEVLEGYHNASKVRNNIFQESQEYASTFQGKVHLSMEKFFGVKFISEEQVRAVLKEKYITTINNKGVKEKIHVHTSFKFDLYLKLNKDLNNYLGLGDKWIGLAIEAMGTYYHSKAFPVQQEADRKKRLICKEKNIILAEIWEDLESSAWENEAIKEIKNKTGVIIPRNKLSELSKYLSKKQK